MKLTCEEQTYLAALGKIQARAFEMAVIIVEARIDSADEDSMLDMVSLAGDYDFGNILDVTAVGAAGVREITDYVVTRHDVECITLPQIAELVDTFVRGELQEMIKGFLPYVCRVRRKLITSVRAGIRAESARLEAERINDPIVGRVARLHANITKTLPKGMLVNVVEFQGQDDDDGALYRIERTGGAGPPVYHDNVARAHLWIQGDETDAPTA